MGEENSYKKFGETLIMLVNIQNLLKDKFFKDKFGGQIQNFISDFINLEIKNKTGGTQLGVSLEKLNADINGFLDLLQELDYLNFIRRFPDLLKTELCLLSIKLEILRKNKNIQNNKGEYKEKGADTKKKNLYPRKTEIKSNAELTASKKKLLDYIRSYPNTRTKDIVYEFNSLSGRTVKRNLTELLRTGLIKKRIDNKAVYYYTSENSNPVF